MKINFTVNIVEVFDEDGNTVETTEMHYKNFPMLFREEFDNVVHELIDDGRIITWEMEDIEAVE